MTQEIRSKIDNILQECATIYSNLGTKTPFDLGTKQAVKRKESELLEQIKTLDEEFYNIVTNSKHNAPKIEEVSK